MISLWNHVYLDNYLLIPSSQRFKSILHIAEFRTMQTRVVKLGEGHYFQHATVANIPSLRVGT